nr:MAG TPA: hypothetical protein [Caudoviricetes sp.]
MVFSAARIFSFMFFRSICFGINHHIHLKKGLSDNTNRPS